MTRERRAALLVGAAALVFVVMLVLGADPTAHFSLADPIPPGWTPAP